MSNQLQDSGPTLDRRFKLGKVIGRGPSGVVYTATDLQTNQPCTVKRLHAHFYNRQVLQLVQRDALAAAKIAHPAMLAPYHVAFEPSGSIYLVCQFVQGESLLTRLQKGPLSLTAALTLFDPLAAALQTAHEAGLYHGAITPTNVLCASSGQVMLTDFGMCHLRATPKIKWGGAMGYAAPETFEEGAELCSARGDVFSLGALAFECLTGQRMFSSTSLATFLASVATPPRLGALLPMYEHLDAVLEMACVQEPEDRFASAGALWRALQSSLLDVPDTSHEEAPSLSPPPASTLALAEPPHTGSEAAASEAAPWEAAAWELAASASDHAPVSSEPPEPQLKHPVQAMSLISMPVGESSDGLHPVPLPPPPPLSTPIKGPIRVHEPAHLRAAKAPLPPDPDPVILPSRTTLPQGVPGKAAIANSEPKRIGAAPAQPTGSDSSASGRARLPTPRLPQLSPAPLPPTPVAPEAPAPAAAAPAAPQPAPPAVAPLPATPAPVAQAAAARPQAAPAPAATPAPAKPAVQSPAAAMAAAPGSPAAAAALDPSSVPTRPMPVVSPAQLTPSAKPVMAIKPVPGPKPGPAAQPVAPPLPAAAVPPPPPPPTLPTPASIARQALNAIPPGQLVPMQVRPGRPADLIATEPQPIIRTDPGQRRRNRFIDRVLPPLFWATLGGCVVGGTMLSLQWLNPGRSVLSSHQIPPLSIPPSLRFDEDALIKVTQQYMAQRNYQLALSAAELVLRAHPDNARARRLADQTSELLRASAVYGGFLRAADQQDADTAAALYAELPADSPFRVNAWEPFVQVRSLFVNRHLNLAGAAFTAGDCDLLSQQIDELRRVVDSERDPDLVQAQRLLTRCRRAYGTTPVAAANPADGAEPTGNVEPVAGVEPRGTLRTEGTAPKEEASAAATPANKEPAQARVDAREPSATGRARTGLDNAKPAPPADKPPRRVVRKKASPKPPGDTPATPSSSPPEKGLPSTLRNPFGP